MSARHYQRTVYEVMGETAGVRGNGQEGTCRKAAFETLSPIRYRPANYVPLILVGFIDL